jgi:hypothetical protein
VGVSLFYADQYLAPVRARAAGAAWAAVDRSDLPCSPEGDGGGRRGPDLPVDLAALERIPGWLHPDDVDLTWRVLRSQDARRIRGDVLELGVYKGRYVALLCALTAEPGDRVVGVDGFFERHGVLLSDDWREKAIQDIRIAVRSVAGTDARLEIVPADTMNLTAADIGRLTTSGFRFVSVDAGHEAENVLNDLRLVSARLVDGGIVAVDDAFNPVVPGVIEGVCRYMMLDGRPRLVPVAIGRNKLFMTSSGAYAEWFEFFGSLVLAGDTAEYLQRARTRLEETARIGYAPRMFGVRIVPLGER